MKVKQRIINFNNYLPATLSNPLYHIFRNLYKFYTPCATPQDFFNKYPHVKTHIDTLHNTFKHLPEYINAKDNTTKWKIIWRQTNIYLSQFYHPTPIIWNSNDDIIFDKDKYGFHSYFNLIKFWINDNKNIPIISHEYLLTAFFIIII